LHGSVATWVRDLMIQKIAFLTAFIGGLALAVHSMLHGVERWRRKRSDRPSAVLNPPTVAALAIGIGATGYLLTSRTQLGLLAVLIVSILVGAAALTGMIVLMAKWALRNPVQSSASGEEEINGQVATVMRTITPDTPGEIEYFAWNKHHVLPASSIDSSIVPEGTEVVIDSVENGIARVELWSVVELRL
jgi:small-conductance mechanosensitive channel